MIRILHALAALYLAAIGVLIYCAHTSHDNGSQLYTALFLGLAVLFGCATGAHAFLSDELRHTQVRLERATRPPVLHPAVADEIALGWQDLAEACCLRWWESKEQEHEPSCERHRSAA